MPQVSEIEEWQVQGHKPAEERVNDDLRTRSVTENVFFHDGSDVKAVVVRRIYDLDTGALLGEERMTGGRA